MEKNSSAGLIFDQAGNLYGTTPYGGLGCSGYGCGTVFELSPNGSGGWNESLLYEFEGVPDGWTPLGGLVFDEAGNLYSTTFDGGDSVFCQSQGCGTVFELSPNGSGGWNETILHNFQNTPDGDGPESGVIIDSKGNLYGTTVVGGIPTDGHDWGTVFELSPNGNGEWKESVYHFHGNGDGRFPESGLVMDSAGNLYGTTTGGGRTGCQGQCGTVYGLEPTPNGSWKEHAISLGDGQFGSLPEDSLILDSKGNLYGTATYGGNTGCIENAGCGTVFEVTP